MTCASPWPRRPCDRQTETISRQHFRRQTDRDRQGEKERLSPVVLREPLMKNTSGTITAMYRIMSHVNRSIPRSNAVCVAVAATAWPSCQKSVRGPLSTTTALAVPLCTLVPRRAGWEHRRAFVRRSAQSPSLFSTGTDSPVRLAWLQNRSLAASTRASPGIMSPAASNDDVTWDYAREWDLRGASIADHCAVTWIIARSAAAAGRLAILA